MSRSSFYILATIVLLCLQDRYPDDLRFTLLAGLTAGLAAWTKNEGLMFLIVVILARAIAVLRFGARPALVRQLGAIAAGLVFPLAVVAFFKLRLSPPNDLTSTGPADMLKHVTDFGRWMTVLQGFGKEAFLFGQMAVEGELVRGFLIPISLVLLLYWFLVRFRVHQRDRSSVATAALAVAFMPAGDFAIYVLLPRDVNWQMSTSLDRLSCNCGLPACSLSSWRPMCLNSRQARRREIQTGGAPNVQAAAQKTAEAVPHGV